MKLSELLKNVNPQAIVGDAGIDVTGVKIDSRQVSSGSLFVAVRGTQVDGHQFISKAVEQGAKVVMCESLPDSLADGVT